ncbi:MAG: iron-sulfur cluster assembly protein [Alphaproteobacteria bacterium]|nr:iron-sulfur cluster assembly protein [Alphaproteobacteria bacterium]
MTETASQENKEAQAQNAEMTERVVEVLRTVYDPEIPVNIYDLGLVYTIDVTCLADGALNLLVQMTLTTANCPMADMIPAMVYDSLTAKIPDFNEVRVELVWEPPWDPSRMSEEARFALDMY